ncbi:hypothetical protein ACFX2L_22615 [Escherichia coli]|uniref:hypothetical protein n=1 Tax=Escherichia coli TaxID=562 RepID=UPI0036A92EEE|nr:hypothetical protein [Escherichia coli]
MENEQTDAVDFVGANRIYLAGLLDEACTLLPELPGLPVPSLDGDDAAVASLLHLMGQRDEMASASGVLVCELDALKDADAVALDNALAASRHLPPETRAAGMELVRQQLRASAAAPLSPAARGINWDE